MPGVVEGPTATVIVEEPPAVIEVGLKLTDVPAGWPPAPRLIACAGLLVTTVLTEAVPLPPGARLNEPGLAPTEKSGAPGVAAKPLVPFGLPRPVGPSYPGPAVHR